MVTAGSVKGEGEARATRPPASEEILVRMRIEPVRRDSTRGGRNKRSKDSHV